MARFYRCRQCGSLEGSVGSFSSEPAECDQCSHEEFEVVGPDRVGFVERVAGNLSVARAVRVMNGLGVLSLVATVLFLLVGVGRALFLFGIVNFVVLLVLAYGLVRHSSVVWTVSALASAVATLVGAAVLVGVLTDLALGSPVVGPVGQLTTSQTALLLVYSVVYLIILANLVGGREHFYADRGA